MIITVYATLLQKRAESERCRNFTTQAFSITYLAGMHGVEGIKTLHYKPDLATGRESQLTTARAN